MKAFSGIAMVVSVVALSQVSADAGGMLQRASRTDGSKTSGCQYANMQHGGELKFISGAAFLDSNNGRIDVVPSYLANCQYNTYTHNTRIVTT